MQTVTLEANDFKTVHNTLCDLRSLARGAHRRSITAEEIEQVIAQFEQGLKNAYEQEEAAFDDKMAYFREFADANDFESIWSLYELPVGCFEQPHPYPSDAFVVYGKGHVPVLGSTWGDVFRAADCAIRNSGDLHHIFVEGFEVKGNELQMYTGS